MRKYTINKKNLLLSALYFIISIFIMAPTCLFSTENANKSLSTPESTIDTYYKAYKTNNSKLIEQTMTDENKKIGVNVFNDTKAELKSYSIIKKRLIKEKEYRFYQKGDVGIIVKEVWRWKDTDTEDKMSFILRKYDNDWLIVDWVLINKEEEPVEIYIEDGKPITVPK